LTSVAPLTVAVLGAGARGQLFASLLAEHGSAARVVAVAEPREGARRAFAARHGIDERMAFASWQAFADEPRLCDAVVVSTMDQDHVGPAVACLEKGYHLLLEKPMATTLEGCRAIAAAHRRAKTIASVCHSLRYHQGFARVKELVGEGAIGQILTIDQLEQVGYWHYAHSYVRGNWGNEGRSTFMLLAKSCHDLDFICYLVDRPCTEVASFGTLSHFRETHAPPGSAARCTDGCSIERSCAYSALRLYVGGPLDGWLRDPRHGEPMPPDGEARVALLRTSPYGRCVWRADNDVVDHQVVLMNFAGGVTATFTMAGLTDKLARRIRVHGTEGELEFEEDPYLGDRIAVRRFGAADVENLRLAPEGGPHGGADRRVVARWLAALRAGDASLVVTSIEESLRTHTVVFAAEAARHRGSVEKLNDSDWTPAEAMTPAGER
jgi:predicted dehydrogenase